MDSGQRNCGDIQKQSLKWGKGYGYEDKEVMFMGGYDYGDGGFGWLSKAG